MTKSQFSINRFRNGDFIQAEVAISCRFHI